MSESTIYHFLRNAGMTRAGALGFMGNMGYESAFRSNNVEDRYHINTGRTDEQYTAAVDNGSYSKDSFVGDAYGYGLCQWTYNTRKAGLYDYAKKKGVSISNEMMQLEYLLIELKRDFSSLFSYLCSCDSMHDATSKVCWQFENPLVKNVGDRYQIACQCANKPYDTDAADPSPATPAAPAQGSTDSCDVTLRILRKGDKGRDVRNLQLMLKDLGYNLGIYDVDGVFGDDTKAALNAFRVVSNLDPNGTADQDVWQILFQ